MIMLEIIYEFLVSLCFFFALHWWFFCLLVHFFFLFRIFILNDFCFDFIFYRIRRRGDMKIISSKLSYLAWECNSWPKAVSLSWRAFLPTDYERTELPSVVHRGRRSSRASFCAPSRLYSNERFSLVLYFLILVGNWVSMLLVCWKNNSKIEKLNYHDALCLGWLTKKLFSDKVKFKDSPFPSLKFRYRVFFTTLKNRLLWQKIFKQISFEISILQFLSSSNNEILGVGARSTPKCWFKFTRIHTIKN